MQSIPEMIANGDLDGDRYFICWDTQILEHVRAAVIEDVAVSTEASKPVPAEQDESGTTLNPN